MVKNCVVCKRLFQSGSGISFHRFPKNAVKKQLWLSNLRIESSSANDWLCSDHFAVDDFVITTRKKCLKPQAVPLILSDAEASVRSTFHDEVESSDNEDGVVVSHTLATMQASLSFTRPGLDAESYVQDPETSSTVTADETPGIITGHSSTETASESEKIVEAAIDTASELKLRVSKKRSRRLYFGDCETSDMESPKRAKGNWQIAKETVIAQRKTIKNLQLARRRLKARVSSLNSLIKLLREKYNLTDNAENLIQASVPGWKSELMKRILKGPSRQKYTPELRTFALTLSFYSTKAYNYVRETFNKSLPHISTITKWYRSIDGSPGFSKEALQAVKMKVQELACKGHKTLCNLVIDEMAIMRRTEWTGSEFIGGTTNTLNIGTSIDADNLPQATEALVFMIVCVNGHWKIPVGYLLLNGLNGKEKANVIMKLLEFLHESEIIVTSLTFDGAPSNFSMASALGAKLNTSPPSTYFLHPITREKIFIFLDICHMLKLVRNCIGDKLNLEDNEGNTISWIYYKRLAELQKEEGLRAGTKLGSRHIQWFREKMKVKLATQTFSNSVANAFIFLRDDIKLEEFADVEATVRFTKIMNDLFDVFNSRSRFSKVFYSRALSSESFERVSEFLRECETYICNLKLNGDFILQTNRKTGFLGFIVCIKSLLGIYEQYVVKTQLLKYILTYKFSQDHLEIFFSIVRSKGGSNNNPTAKQFQNIFKRLLIHTELRGSDHANAIAIDNTSILHCTSSSISRTKFGKELLDSKEYLEYGNDILELEFLSSPAWHLTTYCSDIVAYIAGFVVRNLRKCVNCDHCLNMLESQTPLSKLQVRKQYGTLVNASAFVIDICRTAEKSLRVVMSNTNIFNNKYQNVATLLIHKTTQNLPKRIFEAFGEHLYETDPLQYHPLEIVKLIINKYLNIRFHHEAAKIKDCSETRVRSMLTKTILFKNQ